MEIVDEKASPLMVELLDPKEMYKYKIYLPSLCITRSPSHLPPQYRISDPTRHILPWAAFSQNSFLISTSFNSQTE